MLLGSDPNMDLHKKVVSFSLPENVLFISSLYLPPAFKQEQ